MALVASLLTACAQRESRVPEADCAPTETRGAFEAEWLAAETAGQGHRAAWASCSQPDGTRVVTVESSNGDETFNVLLSRATFGPDLELSTSLRADRGRLDRGGGLVWRAQDADNYYVTRWNPLEDNLRLYKVERGARTMLASIDVALDANAWHELRVRMSGTAITVELDGSGRLEARDATFPERGAVGLWTKADASTSFTLPTVRALSR
ncbi:MAG: hypothetical protein IT454_00060 [Planctomycetes bacterium]|nr:hypothetical protein [Planctomycetota bacterium]